MSLAAEMKRLKRNPSNRYLAGLLGLPRGSVNSSLARMKKRLYALKNSRQPAVDSQQSPSDSGQTAD